MISGFKIWPIKKKFWIPEKDAEFREMESLNLRRAQTRKIELEEEFSNF